MFRASDLDQGAPSLSMLIRPLVGISAKKEPAQNRFQASSVDFMSYVNLVPIVVMMTVVAVIAVSVGPIVRWPRIVAIVPIWSVVSIGIISVTRIANSDRNLSVRTLHGN